VKAMFTKGLMDDTKLGETSAAFNEELQGQPAREREELFSCGPFALTLHTLRFISSSGKVDKSK
jgi:hypothetical protein